MSDTLEDQARELGYLLAKHNYEHKNILINPYPDHTVEYEGAQQFIDEVHNGDK